MQRAPVQNYGGATRYGFPVVDAQKAGYADYLKRNPHVAGMAIGAGLNDDTSPVRSIVVNPFNEYMTDPGARDALIRIEATRHLMHAEGFKPDFPITPEMQAWRRKTFQQGEGYATDDNAFRETAISRAVVGDDAPPLAGVAAQHVARYRKMLDDRDESKSVREMFRLPQE